MSWIRQKSNHYEYFLKIIFLDDQLVSPEAGEYPMANSSGMTCYQEVAELHELASAVGRKHSEVKPLKILS